MATEVLSVVPANNKGWIEQVYINGEAVPVWIVKLQADSGRIAHRRIAAKDELSAYTRARRAWG